MLFRSLLLLMPADFTASSQPLYLVCVAHQCLISFFWAKLHRHAVPFPLFLNSGAWRQIQIRGGLRVSPRNQNARLAIRLVPIMVNTRDRNLQNETCANIGGTVDFFSRLFPVFIPPNYAYISKKPRIIGMLGDCP